MRTRIASRGAGAAIALALPSLALVPLAAPASAQSQSATAPTTQSSEDRVSRLEQRLDQMEKQHQADLRQRDEEIARLRTLLDQRATTAPAPSPAGAATKPAAPDAPDTIQRTTDDVLSEIQGTGPSAAGATGGPTTDQIEKTRRDVMRDAEGRGGLSLSRTPASFNPDIAVISDFVGNYSTNHQAPARNRMDVREVELDFRAAVDPRADAVAILPVGRDVDDPLFFRAGDNVSGDVNTSIDVEEAYLFLHDFGVPDLTAKVGRYHLRFGRWNQLHMHDWITTDNNFVNRSFLGPESLVDQGLSLSYVVPPKLIGENYVEIDAEIISGEGSSDDPVLNNTASVSGPALNTHVLWNHDFGKDGNWNFELGGSWLTGRHNSDTRQDVNLFGTDMTLIRTDPSGGFNNQLVQLEAIYGDVDTSRTATQHSYGAFLLAQQQLNRDFYTGVRFDWTKNALNEHQETWGVSPYLTWYWSEFLRFRTEYQHKGGNVKNEDTLFFQATWIFGAHPPHPYWAVK